MEPNLFPVERKIINGLHTLNEPCFLKGPSFTDICDLQIYVKIFLARVGIGNEIPQNEALKAAELRKSIFKLYTTEYIQQLKDLNPIEAERLATIQQLLTKSAPSDFLLNAVLGELTKNFHQTEILSKITESNIPIQETLQRFASLQLKESGDSSSDLLIARNLLFKSKVQSITSDEDLSEKGKGKLVESLLKEFREDMTPLLKKDPLFTKEALENDLKLIEEEQNQFSSSQKGDNVVKMGRGMVTLKLIKEKSNSFESLITYLHGTPPEAEFAHLLFIASLKAINLLLNPQEKLVEKHKNDDCILM